MDKRQKQRLLHSFKLAVVLVSAIYLAIGTKAIFSKGSGCKVNYSTDALPTETASPIVTEVEECWNEEERYLLAKIAMAEAEGEEPNGDCWEALEMIEDNGLENGQEALFFESESNSSWHKDNLEYLFQHGKHYFYTEKE